MLRLLIGPELFWILLYVLAMSISKSNLSHSKSMNDFIQNAWMYVPLISMVVFGLWNIPMVEKKGLLVRVWISGLLGAHFVVEKMLGSINIQDPGIGTSYIVGMLFEFGILVVGSFVIWFFF